MADISRRKDDHLDLTISGDVGFHQTTPLFECMRFVHDALPELSLDELDTSVVILGKTLRAPILIAGMTGGSERARDINRELASIAEERGYGFGLGSQRAMQKAPSLIGTYAMREVAPTALILGNLGAVQAAQQSTDQVAELVSAVGADAVCIHLNPAMELIQPEGDRDFRGCLPALSRLTRELSVPVVAKETGCGLSFQVGRRLAEAGVRHVDVSGAGGTSWVAVEMHRAPASGRALGEALREWGVPTAASVALVAQHGFDTIFATGGVKTGLDVAKALALGASAAGLARPVLQALDRGGRSGALDFLSSVEDELRAVMLLVGARDVAALRRVPRLLSGPLADWLSQTAR